MKVAVTGATGFIGRYVVTELVRRSIMPVLVVRPGSPLPAELSVFDAVPIDFCQPPPDAYQRLGCPDALLHLAWGGLPNYRSLHHFETELPAHYRFLQSLVRAGLGTLLVAGTCFEYGMQSGALHEALEARPANPYGQAKDTLRRQLELLRAEQPFGLTWARLFYPWGEGQAPNSLYAQLRRAVEAGTASFDMSGGEQLRDYQPVAEVARQLVTLAMHVPDAGVVNVCSGQPVSVRRLVEGWLAEQGWQIRLNLGHYPYPDHEPFAFWGDRRKLEQCLEAR